MHYKRPEAAKQNPAQHPIADNKNVLEMRNESLHAINSASSTIRGVYANRERNFKMPFKLFLVFLNCGTELSGY